MAHPRRTNRSRPVRELQSVFRDRIISLHHATEWPSRSLDLTPCDYFLWEHLKNKVHELYFSRKHRRVERVDFKRSQFSESK